MVIAWVTEEKGAHGAGWYVVDGIMQNVAWDADVHSTWPTDYNMRSDAFFLADYKKRLKKAEDYHDEQLQLDGGEGAGDRPKYHSPLMSKPWHEKVMAQCPDVIAVTDKEAFTRVSDWLGAVRSVHDPDDRKDIPVVALNKVCDIPAALPWHGARRSTLAAMPWSTTSTSRLPIS